MAEITASAVKALRERTGAGMMDCKKALGEAEGDVDKAIEVLRERGLAKAVKRSGRETSEGTIVIAVAGNRGAIAELGCETDFVAKTDQFQALAADVANAALASDADGAEALLAADTALAEKIQGAVGTMGENIVLKRAERLEVGGTGVVGGYVHAGGKLGVLVALATDASGAPVEALAKDVSMHVAAADPSPVAVDRDGVPKDLVDQEAEIFRKQALADGKPEKVVDKIVEGRVRKYYSEVCLVEQAYVKDPDKTVAQLLEEASGQLGSPVKPVAFRRFRLGES